MQDFDEIIFFSVCNVMLAYFTKDQKMVTVMRFVSFLKINMSSVIQQ